MRTLLTAQLYNAEAEIAMSKIEAAQRENRREDVRKLFNTVQQKKADAVQLFDRILLTFGSTEEDYIMEKKSVYNLLLPMSLVQAGDLKLDLDQWDRAAAYYDCAMRFSEPPQIGRTALIKKSVAYQRGGLLDKAADVLKSAAESFPNDTQIRFMYATVLFRSQITSNNASPAMLDVVQEELENLESHRSELIQPWVIDIRLIHLGVARANLTSSAQGIIDAMSEATRKFKALEKQTFPPAADGSVRNYIDDPAFVLELVGIYSSLASRPDFDRLLVTLRKFPNGEDAYYEARINDCLRRDDKEGVVAIIDEANASTTLSASKKEKLIALLQTLKGENVDSAAALEKAYNQLKTTFDESPEMLKPQAFFDLANMSLDKNDPEQAKLVKDRLAKIEGKDGTYWRFIEVRLMLGAKDPDYIGMRKIQEDIVKFRPNWDKAYVLRAMIEERFLTENPGDSAVRQELIKFYLSATEKGNRQPEIWQRISNLYDSIGRPNDAKEIRRQAIQNNVPLDPQTGQLPQPYGRYYTEVVKAIELEDASTADEKARECITLAEKRAEKADLKYILNLTLGKVFLDALMFESAKRHLSAVAERGGKDVYPLAVCVAKSGPDHVDAGFTLILDEIDAVPSSMLQLLPALLVLQMQVKPSEEIYVRIDKLMERIERGERLTLRGKAPSEEGNTIPVGSSYVSSRKVNTMFFRFPDKSDTWDPSLIQFVSPEELSGDKSAAP
jgi:tetratricopeptide (TPR) repeat protein